MKPIVCIICGDKSPIISKRGRKRKKESVYERNLELMLGYLLDNEANKFVDLKTNILKLKEEKAVGLCGKCEVEAEAVLELHLELEKVQMRMIDKLKGVKKLILKLDLQEEREPGEEFLSTLKDFQAAIKENTEKGSIRIPFVFLERYSGIRQGCTTYLLLENQVKTEPEPVSYWDDDSTPAFQDPFEDSAINPAVKTDPDCNVAQPTQTKRGRGRPKGSCSKKTASRSIQKVKVRPKRRLLKLTKPASILDSAPTSDLKNEEKSTISKADYCSNIVGAKAKRPQPTRNAGNESWPYTTTKLGRGRPRNLKPKRKVKLNRLLICETCSFETKRPYRLEEHLRSHETDDQPFTCEECAKKFSTKQYLNFHLNLHKTKVKCEVCPEKYKALEALAHLKTHAEVVLPCSKCHKCYISPDLYFKHLKLKHEGHGLTCPLCQLPMQNQKALLELMEHCHQVHNIGEELKCDFEGCGKTFIDSDGLAKHKIIHTNLYICRICQRPCSTSVWLRKHEMSHSGLKPFKCDQCVAEFHFQEALDKHFKKVHEGVRFKCDKCEKDYSEKTGLRHHMIMEHGAATKSVCEICGQRFGGKTMLEKHMETTHSTGEKKYVCDECGKSFLARRHYWHHKQTHGEKKYKCSYCPSAFAKRTYLIHHENIHTCAKTFPCPFCGIVYKQLSSMVAHKRKCGKTTN